MGWRDREYARHEGRWSPFAGPRRRPTLGGRSIVRAIIFANIAAFVLTGITGGPNPETNPILKYGAMSAEGVLKGHVWRLFTAEYLHWNFNHILMNMLGLWFLGLTLEREWGPRRFFAVYTFAGFLGMVFYLVLAVLGWLPIQSVAAGASGCVLGLLGVCAVRYPSAEVYIYFLFPIKIRTAALVFGGWYVLNLFNKGPNAGGDACHLAGLIFGAWWAWKGEFWWDRMSIRRASGPVSAGPARRQASPRTESEVYDAELIDCILKKVYEGGIHSLTESEKQALRDATERQRSAESGRFRGT